MQVKIKVIFIHLLLISFAYNTAGAATIPFREGEWITTSINAPAAGTYEIALRVASEGSGGTLAVQVDGETKESALTVPNTGSQTSYTTIKTSRFTLSSGSREVKVLFQSNSSQGYAANLNWLYLKLVSPSNLRAVVMSDTSIKLTWEDNSDYETSVVVQRKTGSTSYSTIATLDADIETYTNTGLSSGVTYTYKVTGYNGSTSLGSSAEVQSSISDALIPGSGWTGETPQPAAIGTSDQAGYDANAIARWDVVPYQTFNGDFEIGVPAFHMNGIDRVEFSVNGGPWVAVSEMTLNPRTDVVEYWTTLRASSFSSDGQVEVRAIAYPTVGKPRVLQGNNTTGSVDGIHSMFLYTNAGGTYDTVYTYCGTSGNDESGDGSKQNPYQTLAKAIDMVAENGTVRVVDGGEYLISNGANGGSGARTSKTWVTIEPDESLSLGDVTIVQKKDGSRTSLYMSYCRFHNIQFDFRNNTEPRQEKDNLSINPGGSAYAIWFDSCKWIDTNEPYYANGDYYVYYEKYLNGKFVTDSTADDMFKGFFDFSLVRNCACNDIHEDVFSGSELILNSSGNSINPVSGTHNDILQYFAGEHNCIMYNVTITSSYTQGLFFQCDGCDSSRSSVSDTAIVDVAIDCVASSSMTQFSGRLNHLLFKNFILLDKNIRFHDLVTIKDMVFSQCGLEQDVWDDYIDGEAPTGVSFEDCFIVD